MDHGPKIDEDQLFRRWKSSLLLDCKPDLVIVHFNDGCGKETCHESPESCNGVALPSQVGSSTVHCVCRWVAARRAVRADCILPAVVCRGYFVRAPVACGRAILGSGVGTILYELAGRVRSLRRSARRSV